MIKANFLKLFYKSFVSIKKSFPIANSINNGFSSSIENKLFFSERDLDAKISSHLTEEDINFQEVKSNIFL